MVEAARNEMVVKRHLEAVSEVRRFVRLAVSGWGMDDFVPCLVASELVTNSIRYASEDEVTLRLGLADDGALWMEVQDASCDLPRVQWADVGSESGRGLFVVEQFTRCWGVRALAGRRGKIVFAVLESEGGLTGAGGPG